MSAGVAAAAVVAAISIAAVDVAAVVALLSLPRSHPHLSSLDIKWRKRFDAGASARRSLPNGLYRTQFPSISTSRVVPRFHAASSS